MNNNIINWNIVKLDQIDSTNNYAKELIRHKKAGNGTLVITGFQSDGRGMHGNTWESEPGSNLTFSIILYPDWIKAERLFYISKFISLSVFDFLKTILTDVTIKWPNDIYAGDKKIAGILIENEIIRDSINYSVIGIGLNVNQDHFTKKTSNPVSMKILTGKLFNLDELLNGLLTCLEKRYEELKSENYAKIATDYLNHLYRFDKLYDYKTEQGIIKARIIAVGRSGELVLCTDDSKIVSYMFKEIRFVD
jgi:BirA family biotin operon repressor/biotin-[acetyl-CoA-carboxylase] ligase